MTRKKMEETWTARATRVSRPGRADGTSRARSGRPCEKGGWGLGIACVRARICGRKVGSEGGRAVSEEVQVWVQERGQAPRIGWANGHSLERNGVWQVRKGGFW